LKHIVATCYDDEETLHQKYPQAKQIILQLLSADPAIAKPSIASLREEEDLEWRGLSPSPSVMDATQVIALISPTAAKTLRSPSSIPSTSPRSVHYAINATKLSSTYSKLLRTQAPFTKIVFNFPHVGGLSTDVNRQVRANQELLVGFFKAAIPLLASTERPVQTEWGHGESGEHGYDDSNGDDDEVNLRELNSENKKKAIVTKGQILVTLFEGEPYTLWNIRDLARHSGLKVVESFHFPWQAYPGYAHARTVGEITSGKDRTTEGKRKGAWRGEEREARCFMLEVKEDELRDIRSRVGTEANKVDLGTRKRKSKGLAGETESESGSD
jgi:25S rRNA (uracil2634-N3)-methyltransferase